MLDEADRLFDLGFSDELGRILGLLPLQRQNLFFSATFPPAVQALAQQLLRDPVRIDVLSEAQGRPDIAQRAIAVDAGRRTQLLRHLMQQNAWRRVLVFVATKHATKHAAEIVADKLRKARINAEPFHGELSQGKRTQVLADFKASRLKVVIATDVAARGIDIAQLPVVVNYDLPRSPLHYIHRIGRTGRAGETGVALSFVSADTEAHFRLIEKHQRLSLPREVIEGFEPLQTAPAITSLADSGTPSTGGIKGNNMSGKWAVAPVPKLSGVEGVHGAPHRDGDLLVVTHDAEAHVVPWVPFVIAHGFTVPPPSRVTYGSCHNHLVTHTSRDTYATLVVAHVGGLRPKRPPGL